MTIFNMIFLQDAATVKAVADSLQAKAAATKELFEGKTTDEALQTLLNHAIIFGLKLLAALVIFTIGGWLIGRIRKRVNKRMTKRRPNETTVISFTDSLLAIVMWIMLIVITVGLLGINTTSIAALLAAGGMAIGMALSGTLQNFAGGIILLLFKPFKSGDIIEAQGNTGVVKSMNIVSTTLLTRDNKTVIIPNGALSNGNITNLSALSTRRVDWVVNVPYGTDCDQVIDALVKIIKSDSRVLDSSVPHASEPYAGMSAMKESCLEFKARAWVAVDDYWPVFYDINKKIYTELPKKGIHFPFPQLDVHIKQQ